MTISLDCWVAARLAGWFHSWPRRGWAPRGMAHGTAHGNARSGFVWVLAARPVCLSGRAVASAVGGMGGPGHGSGGPPGSCGLR
jgi:hypothetical protein